MKLTCQKCNLEISSDHVNIREGVAYCSTCQEYYRIADYLRDDEELRRLSKPYYSRVTIDSVLQHHLVTIPPGGWNGTSLFFLLFGTFWNGMVLFSLLFSKNLSGPMFLFLIPFLLTGLAIIFCTLFMVKGIAYINFNKQTIELIWQLFGIRYRKVRQTSNLAKITESVAYTKNYQPVYGIGLLFNYEKKIVFGSSLKEEERKWLIGELYEMKIHYQRTASL